MKDNSTEVNIKKYTWLHRLHVSSLLYILFQIVGELLKYPEIKLLFFPILAAYLLYPNQFDSIFPFTKRFYKLTLAFSFIGTIGTGSMPHTTARRLNFFGDFGLIILFFLTFNSAFILTKVLKMNLKKILHEKIWE